MTSLSTSPQSRWSIWYSRRSSSCSAQRSGHRQPCHSCRCGDHSIIFWKIRNFSTKIPLSNKISLIIKRKKLCQSTTACRSSPWPRPPLILMASATGLQCFPRWSLSFSFPFFVFFRPFEDFQLPFRWQLVPVMVMLFIFEPRTLWKCDLLPLLLPTYCGWWL